MARTGAPWNGSAKTKRKGNAMAKANVMTTTMTVELAQGIQARFTLKREGQQHPSEGDGMQVRATIDLPAECGSLIKALQFGKRVNVADFGLHPAWGRLSPDNRWLQRDRLFVRPTWAGAFRVAKAWARKEIGRLEVALTTRQRALDNA